LLNNISDKDEYNIGDLNKNSLTNINDN